MISRGVRANEGTQDLQRESGKDAIQLGGIFCLLPLFCPPPPILFLIYGYFVFVFRRRRRRGDHGREAAGGREEMFRAWNKLLLPAIARAQRLE